MKKILACSILLLFSIPILSQWVVYNTSSPTIFRCLSFPNASNGFAGGGDSTTGKAAIFYTADGGMNWAAATIVPQNIYNINGMTGINADSAYAVADSGRVLRKTTLNGSWDTVARAGKTNLRAIFFLNYDTGFVCGDNGALYKTINAGASWDTLNSGTTQTIRSIYFVNDTTGFFAGDGGIIKKTTDGGTIWTFLVNPYFGFFNARSISFINATNGFIAGASGKMIATTDGGATFSTAATGLTTAGLNAISFANPVGGIVVGDSGKIYRTDDGGAIWTDYGSGTVKVNLDAVYCVSSSIIFAAGGAGRILSTTSAALSASERTFSISFKAYPNPFSDRISLDVFAEQNSRIEVILLDLLGREMPLYSGDLPAGEQTLKFDLNELLLAQGVYFIRLRSEKSSSAVKLIKK